MRSPTRAILVLLTLTTVSSAQDLAWSAVKAAVRAAYPDVRHITVDSLARWLEGPDTGSPVLLDARAAEEYAISHLQGALPIGPAPGDLSVLEGSERGTPIVVYCSVGYRSAEVARALQRRGFTDVFNLEGSIFEWANRGLPLFRTGQPVDVVHPYDALWGRLLDADRQYSASEPD